MKQNFTTSVAVIVKNSVEFGDVLWTSIRVQVAGHADKAVNVVESGKWMFSRLVGTDGAVVVLAQIRQRRA